jgi:preprotein translocase subunit SecG
VYGVMIVIHVLICGALVISVLLQSAKGEGLAGAFGGTSLTGTVFGGRGAATFLSKATTILAIAFMGSCIVLTFLNPTTRTGAALGGSSAVEEAAHEQPAAPPPATTQPATQGATDQPAGQPPSGPASELFNQPAGEGEGTATEQPQAQPGQQPAQQPAEQPAEQPGDQPNKSDETNP